MKLINTILILGVLLSSNSVSRAQGTVRKMDSVFNWQAEHGMLMGNLLVADKGKVVYQRSFGYQDLEQKKLNTDSSGFALASIAKVFTSTAILQLKEKGMLKLDEPFNKYFPEFMFPDITIRHLLNHTSGLPEYELFDSLAKANPDKIYKNEDIIPALKVWPKRLYFKPGTNWRYSSMNFCLLALLIEKRSGLTLQQYFYAHIFEPSGMKQSYVDNLITSRANKYRTQNYQFLPLKDSLVNVNSLPGEHQMIYNYGGFSGQGSLTSTVNDMLLFDKAFFSYRLLSSQSVKEALTPSVLNNGKKANTIVFDGYGLSYYGLGWFIPKDTTGGLTVYHPGGRPGVGTQYAHNISKDQTVILLGNISSGEVIPSAVSALRILNRVAPLEQKVSLARIYAITLAGKGNHAARKIVDSLKSDQAHYNLHPQDWIDRAKDLFTAGNKELAMQAIETGLTVFPAESIMTEAYGDVLRLTGQKDDAALQYKKAIEQDKKNKNAKEKLARLQKG
ncbi:MAG TPA: serine hydrolase [Pedobacter sp.]|uniref:serine hydrolase n=1 Tax=Pedobacter sp. TaxID=1411316 RepID=UPI002C428D79|nr:serine hydrolase [Pedobacter sp.]HMI04854.1 serine hydrolase [Pedobacter sp.]